MHLQVTLNEILIAGAIAGFTIYLGLPIALVSVSRGLRVFLNAVSVGILLFLFVEIVYQVIERIESLLKLSVVGFAETSDFVSFILLFVAGFAFAMLGLVWFEKRFIHTSPEMPAIPGDMDTGSRMTPNRTAVMIALGIGLHNFSEGLIIGQSFTGGAIGLGLLLVVGFALHNGTEGFGIAAPLAGAKPRLLFLFVLGLIGGGPTVIGTYLGTFWASEPVEVLFLALAAGAILYIVGELIHIGRLKGQHMMMTWGLLMGFFIALASDLVIERAMVQSLEAHASGNVIEIEAGEFFFRPDEIQLNAGEPVKLMITNKGTVDHEIEIFGKGIAMEQVIPLNQTIPVYLHPRYAGIIPFICDMPGHLSGGMHGKIIVR